MIWSYLDRFLEEKTESQGATFQIQGCRIHSFLGFYGLQGLQHFLLAKRHDFIYFHTSIWIADWILLINRFSALLQVSNHSYLQLGLSIVVRVSGLMLMKIYQEPMFCFTKKRVPLLLPPSISAMKNCGQSHV